MHRNGIRNYAHRIDVYGKHATTDRPCLTLVGPGPELLSGKRCSRVVAMHPIGPRLPERQCSKVVRS